MFSEAVCEDCMEGDHEACRREGGWMFFDIEGRPGWATGHGDDRCGCHLTDHVLDRRGR